MSSAFEAGSAILSNELEEIRVRDLLSDLLRRSDPLAYQRLMRSRNNSSSKSKIDNHSFDLFERIERTPFEIALDTLSRLGTKL